MTPLNQKQGYKEAKVGVIFWSQDHQKVQGKRGLIRQREYVATLKSREQFRQRVSQLYNQIAAQKPTQTVVIGDGAPWIWSMAQEQFPGAVEILDFFHLSEYVWVVTQRLKQAGMHWSARGAEGVMALRAAYLSNSPRWSSFWKENSTIKSVLAS
jgi:transposase